MFSVVDPPKIICGRGGGGTGQQYVVEGRQRHLMER